MICVNSEIGYGLVINEAYITLCFLNYEGESVHCISSREWVGRSEKRVSRGGGWNLNKQQVDNPKAVGLVSTRLCQGLGCYAWLGVPATTGSAQDRSC